MTDFPSSVTAATEVLTKSLSPATKETAAQLGQKAARQAETLLAQRAEALGQTAIDSVEALLQQPSAPEAGSDTTAVKETSQNVRDKVLQWVLQNMKVAALLLVLKVCVGILVVVLLVVLGFSWYQQYQLRSLPQQRTEE